MTEDCISTSLQVFASRSGPWHLTLAQHINSGQHQLCSFRSTVRNSPCATAHKPIRAHSPATNTLCARADHKQATPSSSAAAGRSQQPAATPWAPPSSGAEQAVPSSLLRPLPDREAYSQIYPCQVPNLHETASLHLTQMHYSAKQATPSSSAAAGRSQQPAATPWAPPSSGAEQAVPSSLLRPLPDREAC
jgi:hypothetical protein